MKHRLIRALAALALAFGTAAAPSGAAPVHAGSVCTGWTSTVIPPDTIRVYRSATRRTQVVAFRTYVEKVMASEWGARTTGAAMRAGAITVKQYGWYYAMHWRGKSDTHGACYDVVDSTTDQLYNPSRTPSPEQLAAVAATWYVALRRGDSFFLTGYRPGDGHCLAHIDGYRLYQRDAVNCVSAYRDSTETVLRRFYSSLSMVEPGAHDVSGDRRGDAILAVIDPATGELAVRVITSDAAYARAVGPRGARTLDIAAPETVLGRAAGDVNGDGRTDLVELVASGSGTELRVLLASPTGFAAAATWWSRTGLPADLRLVVGDFDGDGVADAGVVRVYSTSARVLVVRSTRAAFAKDAWMTPFAGDYMTARFLAGDFTGDGRADVAIATPITADTGAVTTQTSVAASTPGLALAAPVAWAVEPAPPDQIVFLAADVDRTGRDDLVLARRAGAGSRLLAYRSTGISFTRAWFTAIDASIPFATTRYSAADWDGDGRGDLLAYRDLGVDGAGASLGTAVTRYTSTGTAFGKGPIATDSTLDWPTFIAY